MSYTFLVVWGRHKVSDRSEARPLTLSVIFSESERSEAPSLTLYASLSNFERNRGVIHLFGRLGEPQGVRAKRGTAIDTFGDIFRIRAKRGPIPDIFCVQKLIQPLTLTIAKLSEAKL